MCQILSRAIFFDSFSQIQKEQAIKYLEAKKLFERISNKSEISRLIKVPNRTVQEWLNNTKKPIAIRQWEKLEQMNLVKLCIGHNNQFKLFIDLFAFLFGDGHLMKNLGGIQLCGNVNDLEKLKTKIEMLFGVPAKVTFGKQVGSIKKLRGNKLTEVEVNGYCGNLWVNSSALARLFYVLGVPKGDKVEQAFELPAWLMCSPEFVKKRFLGVLFGNELSLPKIRAKNAFGTIMFGMHKIEGYKSELILFLNQLRVLLKEFDVNTTKPQSEKVTCLKKSGAKSGKSYFLFKTNAKNILTFYNAIPLLYASLKQNKFDKMVKQIINAAKQYSKDWEIYDKAIELHLTGLGHTKIFRVMNLPKKYLYRLNAWIYYGNKPRFYDIRDFVENY
ncbi:MAG: hypothetical protein HOE11_00465 [Candidatus Diapherotrites archaeon]|nr:hypothetical protein [Candidatus Diapherotrites archaeon]MBT4596913.1 hypothetical protein [Candidatus Diapherotrites archaeon]